MIRTLAWALAPVFVVTAAHVREGPGTDTRSTRTLTAGTQVSVAETKGDWIRLDTGGWVHASLTADTYVSVPTLDDANLGAHGWVVGWNEARAELLEIVDDGHQAAVDGPALSLCVLSLREARVKRKKCIRSEYADRGTQREHLEYLWNAEGLSVQKLLADRVRPSLKRADDKLSTKIVTKRDQGRSFSHLQSVSFDGRVIWSDKALDNEIAKLVRSVRIGKDFLVVVIETDPFGDCCTETIAIAVPLTSSREP